MRPQSHISEACQISLKKLLREAKTKSETRKIIVVLLRATSGLTAQDIAKSVGLSKGGVEQIIANYLKLGSKSLLDQVRGGRRNAYMTALEEKKFVDTFLAQSKNGSVIVVNDIIQAYSIQTGQTVAKSTVYRLLARHGWRQITPRKKHPKANPELQVEFKKKSIVKN